MCGVCMQDLVHNYLMTQRRLEGSEAGNILVTYAQDYVDLFDASKFNLFLRQCICKL